MRGVQLHDAYHFNNNLIEAKLLLGRTYLQMDDYDKALRYIRESLSIDSDNATIQGHLDEIIKNKAEINTQKMQQAEN